MTDKQKIHRREAIKKKLVYAVLYASLGLLVLISIIPIYVVLINTTRDGASIQLAGLSLIPSKFLIENYNALIEYADIKQGFFNSLYIAISVTVLSGYFSALTAYGFYMYKFRGNKSLFSIILIFMMVPAQLSLIGFVSLMIRFGLFNSHLPLIIPAIASIGTVFFLRQYVSATVNKEIIESARIDGANEIRIFHKIGIPLMMPGIATMSIFTFIGSWNNYLSARVLIVSRDKFTLPMTIASLRTVGEQGVFWREYQGAVYLGFAFSIVPIIIIFIFASRYLIESIAAGAVKG